ncbi:glycoside hydrolase family 32 protein [Seonamhaeicola maritimus]|uniref:Glycoside hydrolase family 32 protein n=1 Tax=Seonamhaeicola maritimus TaxID=2591822 RepID=A0A5C7GJ82_9FLAO|nr:glycoside hydrolase family 32 protein [Seonamhaeicola maritimus]TXG37479.1 glycoside hydrolase family 32 protein [Seonamhaeicola maritimus]
MKTIRNLITIIFVLFLFVACRQKAENSAESNETISEISYTEEELYRPNFHFTPKKAWMNDPNGMFYYNGYYHLYFQYHPDGNVWGPMHWGHATSTDMISWVEQPIAIYPDELGTIFSGSAVVDIGNTSGFGEVSKAAPIVAMYTNHLDKGDDNISQTQSIAYSNDEGKTFAKFENNPVIDANLKDFRDPKVTWDEERNKWVMVLAAGDKIMFYDSNNLKNWNLLSEFQKEKGSKDGVWECPDLFNLPVVGTDESKWVLFVSIGKGGPNGGSATEYFIGDFDGTTFTMDKDFETSRNKENNYWIDFGRDNYAGVSWSNARRKDGSKLIIGWMSNWDYAQKVPTETWRSAMTIAREVKLQKDDNGYKLLFNPVKELANYRSKKYKNENIEVKGDTKIIDSESIDLASVEIKFNISDLVNDGFTFNLTNKLGDTLAFGYNSTDKNFFVDRRKSGKVKFSENFANEISVAKRTSLSTNISGTIILDKTSIELFFNNGETVMTEVFFPNAPFEKLSIEPKAQEFILGSIEMNKLNFN